MEEWEKDDIIEAALKRAAWIEGLEKDGQIVRTIVMSRTTHELVEKARGNFLKLTVLDCGSHLAVTKTKPETALSAELEARVKDPSVKAAWEQYQVMLRLAGVPVDE
jgi:hypothetical protein